MNRPSHPDNDRGGLRLVLAVPLTLLTLIAAYSRSTALTIRPSGSWHDDAYVGIVLSCVLTIGAAGAATGLWLLSSVRRAWGGQVRHAGSTNEYAIRSGVLCG
jgi:hypothetical protein